MICQPGNSLPGYLGSIQATGRLAVGNNCTTLLLVVVLPESAMWCRCTFAKLLNCYFGVSSYADTGAKAARPLPSSPRLEFHKQSTAMLAMMSQRPPRMGAPSAMFPHDSDIEATFRYPFPEARMMTPATAFYACGHRPKLEIKDDVYIIRIEMAGVKQEHLQVELLGRRSLLVSDQTQTEQTEQQQQQQGQRPPSMPSHQLCKPFDLPCDAD
eukprot:2563998-Rhodomonas_salina.1